MLKNNKTEYKLIEKLKIEVDGSGDFPRMPTPEDEKYKLTVNKEGISIHTNTAIGAINAISTLVQLVQCERLHKRKFDYMECHIPNGPFLIEDQPAFAYRSLLIDTSRNFIPLRRLKEVVDIMGGVKMNVL